jgi:hypothetical protein
LSATTGSTPCVNLKALEMIALLAVKHQGRLVTLDQGIPLAAVQGAQAKHLVVLAGPRSPF